MSRLLLDPFHAVFMQRALAEILLLSLLAGVVSVYVLLRRLAFVGDAMTHTIFPGVAIAFVTGHSLFLGGLLAGVVSAVLLTVSARIPRIDNDAALGVMVGAFFSVGVVIVSARESYTADLTALLFGRVLTVDAREILETAVVAVVVLGVLAFSHKELVFRAFDPGASEALGYGAARLDLMLNVLIALVVVAGVRAVGTVLVIALIVVPGAIARLVSNRIGPMIVVSVAVAALCGYAGLAVSYEASVHHDVRLGSGATIVVALTAVFTVVAVVEAVSRRRRPVVPA